jgi:hypothetical protein
MAINMKCRVSVARRMGLFEFAILVHGEPRVRDRGRCDQ